MSKQSENVLLMRFGSPTADNNGHVYSNYSTIASALNMSLSKVKNICFEQEFR